LITPSLLANLTKFKLTQEDKTSFVFFDNLLANYPEFDIIIHVDNATQYVANDWLLVYPTLTTIFNHDTSDMARPVGRRYLNVVFLNNPLSLCTYLAHDNIYSFDIIIFIITSPSFKIITENYQLMTNLSKSSNIVVIKRFKSTLSVSIVVPRTE
jgi:hypothetical protein